VCPKRLKRVIAQPWVMAAEQPKPWVRNEPAIEPCKGGAEILFRAYSALYVFMLKPRAYALGFAIPPFRG
jgi:hypothetical protein